MHTDQFQPEASDFEFRGSAREFFGIWIVNLLLSIVTLGIYSAWAKVRTTKYFHQHTYVAGRNFDYHATGLQILIGRLIVIAGLVVFSILSTIPILGLVLTIALLVLIPFLLVRALRFKARMSSWSNARFDFQGSVGGAAKIYYLYPILAALTLYSTWPFFTRAAQRFFVDGHRLGKTPFRFDGPIAPFYKAFLLAGIWVVGVNAALTGVGGVNLSALAAFAQDPSDMHAGMIVAQFYLIVFVAFLPAGMIYSALVRNTVYAHTTLGTGHKFQSNVSPTQLVWIALSNLVVVVGTLGLMLPWAKVRLARYMAAHTRFLPGGSLDDFVNGVTSDTNAIGDAYGDIEGFDVGFSV